MKIYAIHEKGKVNIGTTRKSCAYPNYANEEIMFSVSPGARPEHIVREITSRYPCHIDRVMIHPKGSFRVPASTTEDHIPSVGMFPAGVATRK